AAQNRVFFYLILLTGSADALRWGGFFDRKKDLEGSTPIARANLHLTSELADTFPYSADADAGRVLRMYRQRQSHAFALVFHVQPDLVGQSGDGDFRGRAAGMAMHVGETLLDNTEQRQLEFAAEASKIFWNFKLNLDLTALRKTGNVPAQSGEQAYFVEQRRMKQIREGADLAQGFVQKRITFVEELEEIGIGFGYFLLD